MDFKNIIAAIDLDDDLAEGVVLAAKSLADKDKARLQVVCVWPPVSAVTPTFSAEVAASSAVLSKTVIEQHRQGRVDSEKKLAGLVDKLSPGAEPVMLDGEAAETVARYAKDIGADLIVTGSHQRSFWDSLFQGSASRELVREAPCAVFLVTKMFAERFRKS